LRRTADLHTRGDIPKKFGWGCTAHSLEPLPYFRPDPNFYTLFQICKELLRFAHTFEKSLKFPILFKTHFLRKENNFKKYLFVKNQTKNLTLFQMVKSIPYSVRLKGLENYTLWGHTSLSGLHKGVSPPPHGPTQNV